MSHRHNRHKASHVTGRNATLSPSHPSHTPIRGVTVVTRVQKDSAEVERLIRFLPVIVRSDAVSDWEREFCISILSRNQKGRWLPSQRQAAVMRRVVDAFVRRELRDNPLIEP